MAYLLKLTEPLEMMIVPYGDHKDWLVVKVGQHGKEERKTGVIGRLKGHQQEFKEFKDTMKYMHFVFVDPMYVIDVETRIKEYFSEFQLDFENKSEIYLVHKSKL
jgi:site-specific DNA-adenine methylase